VNKIAKCTIFLGDMSEWGEMNVAYIEALGDHRPARSALGASGLALGGSVEIECIAAR
jgi:enamine deaminase RidA (YjgF/YER057c/UK114 family)